jgi:hypothetical protein
VEGRRVRQAAGRHEAVAAGDAGVRGALAAEATVTVVVPEVGLAIVPNSRSRVAVSWPGATMLAWAVVLASTGAAPAAARRQPARRRGECDSKLHLAPPGNGSCDAGTCRDLRRSRPLNIPLQGKIERVSA